MSREQVRESGGEKLDWGKNKESAEGGREEEKRRGEAEEEEGEGEGRHSLFPTNISENKKLEMLEATKLLIVSSQFKHYSSSSNLPKRKPSSKEGQEGGGGWVCIRAHFHTETDMKKVV